MNKNTKYIVIIGVFFFIFGFITWINGTLIPYLRIACELEEWQAYLVTFSFYISYTAMAIPSSRFLEKSGMLKGMSVGLAVMAIGCLIFIPAAYERNYGIFLTGLFFSGGGMTLLQTAVNPYITRLGPERSAARRISIMGICNKVAGILAPLIMGSIILKNSGGLIRELEQMGAVEKKIRLDELSKAVVVPYMILAGILLLLAILIRYVHLPEIRPGQESNPADEDNALTATNVKGGPSVGAVAVAGSAARGQYALGFTAIFFAVGAEVLAGDTIGNYGLFHHLSLDTAKSLTSYTLAAMMIGYITGVGVIPRYITQQRAFYIASWLGLLVTFLILVAPGVTSVSAVALLGLGNAMLWPAIWPQALRGLRGASLARGSAILIMGIAGGALMPLCYSWLARSINNCYAYSILIPTYGFLLYYSIVGKKNSN